MIKILLAANLNKELYINAVTGCGAEAHAVYCPQYSEEYDALILCGGNDISPSYYNEEMCGSREIDNMRDTAEFELADKFIKAGKPVMGICRGHQLLNVYFGGSLYQDIENVRTHRSGTETVACHIISAVDNSILHSLYGKEFMVNSIHHQAVKKLGDGLVVTAVAEDGTVEAFEHTKLPVLGVQWHPERMCFENKNENTVDGAKIIEYFVKMCENKKQENIGG